MICHSEQRIKIFIPILLFAYRSHFIPCFAMFPLPFFVCRPMVNRCRVHSFIVSRYIHSNGLCRCFPFPAYFYWLWTKKNNNNGNLIPLEIGSFPFYPDCNIYSRSMFGVRLDIFYMYEYWKLFELRGKSISLTSMARTTHARKCLWIVQITTMRAINHSLSERLKCKHNNTCTHTHTFFPQQNYFYCYWWHYYLGLG